MAKFLAELLGCTLPSKGASPMFEKLDVAFYFFSTKCSRQPSKSHSRVGLKSSTKQKTTIFSTLASEKSLSDCKKEQQWKLSMYSRSIPPVCFTSPLIEKPVGKEPPAVTYRKDACNGSESRNSRQYRKHQVNLYA
ncbi:uncharacterized protein LOC115295959 [Suricata suricatta]|uniref:uncharacterized protein LOC115295959 n=1 Tax=Suricata suricatta TaxID=37032 RepID=UPI00115568BD|nr:uncharacterized protein LOC115295959 [Suricata suricatta]